MEEQEILFKNTTNMNEECKKEFMKFIWLRYNNFEYWIAVIMSIMNLILLGIYRIVSQIRNDGSITSSNISVILGCLVVIFIILRLPNRKTKRTKNLLYKYEFSDKYMQSYNGLVLQKIWYTNIEAIKSVCNTDKYIYFMYDKTGGMVIDKRGFDGDEEELFKDYIKNKFNGKYIDFTDKRDKKKYKQLFDLHLPNVVCSILSWGLALAFINTMLN